MLRSDFLVSAKGGFLEYISKDGEVLAQVAVPAGKVSARDYVELFPEADKIVANGVAVWSPSHRMAAQVHPALRESGANPDFQPNQAEYDARRMRQLERQMYERTNALERMMANLASAQVMPQGPGLPAAPAPTPPADGGEVVE